MIQQQEQEQEQIQQQEKQHEQEQQQIIRDNRIKMIDAWKRKVKQKRVPRHQQFCPVTESARRHVIM